MRPAAGLHCIPGITLSWLVAWHHVLRAQFWQKCAHWSVATCSSRAILAKVRALERRNLFFARNSDKSARIGARNTAIREHLRLKRARNGAQTVIWDSFCRKHAKNGYPEGNLACFEEKQSRNNYNTSRNAVLLIVTVSVLS